MKTKAIMLRVSEEEQALIQASAAKYGLSVSAFIRMLIHLFGKEPVK